MGKSSIQKETFFILDLFLSHSSWPWDWTIIVIPNFNSKFFFWTRFRTFVLTLFFILNISDPSNSDVGVYTILHDSPRVSPRYSPPMPVEVKHTCSSSSSFRPVFRKFSGKRSLRGKNRQVLTSFKIRIYKARSFKRFKKDSVVLLYLKCWNIFFKRATNLLVLSPKLLCTGASRQERKKSLSNSRTASSSHLHSPLYHQFQLRILFYCLLLHRPCYRLLS